MAEPTVAELAALLTAAERHVSRAAAGAKLHAQDRADAEILLPQLHAALERAPKPVARVSEDGRRVEYLPA